MKRAFLFGLASVGAIAIAIFICVAAYWGHAQYRANHPRPADLLYILNWADLGDRRIASIRHTQVSSRSFTGDHVDAYCLQLDRVPADLSQQRSPRQVWRRGPIGEPVLADAIAAAAMFARGDAP